MTKAQAHPVASPTLKTVWPFLRSLLGGQSADSPPVERRQGKRFRVESVTCNLGEIVDLSGFGARIRCEENPRASVGQVLQLTLRSPRRPMRVMSDVVRVSRLGRRIEIGVRFLALEPGIRAELHELARGETRRAAG